MARSPKIRITENDRKEYSRLVKNTKAKVNRTIKNVGRYITDAERDETGNVNIIQRDIMEMFQVPALTEFETRAEFNEWKEKQSKITSGKNPHYNFKKNEFGLAASEYALTVAENRLYKAEVNQRKERAKFGDIPVAGTGQTVAERQKMLRRPDKTGFGKLKFNFNDMMDFRHFESRIMGLNKRADPHDYDKRKRAMKENWIKMIEEAFGSDADDVIRFASSLSDDEFYALYLHEEEEEVMVFNLFYNDDYELQGSHEQLNKIAHHFEQYANGMLEIKPENVDALKGF